MDVCRKKIFNPLESSLRLRLLNTSLVSTNSSYYFIKSAKGLPKCHIFLHKLFIIWKLALQMHTSDILFNLH
jgi:hypothetical protein